MKEKTQVQTRYGAKYTQNGVVADNTASRKITVWQKHIGSIQPDHYYRMENVATNNFNSEIWINTTSSTKIQEIKSIGDVVEDETILKNQKKTLRLQQQQLKKQESVEIPNA